MDRIGIIGGGASAIICALKASENINNKITILNGDSKLGKKLLVTGNGRCNLTNLDGFSDAYNCDISTFLDRFDWTKTIKFFNNIGLEIYADEEKRVYPISNSSSTVREILEREVVRNNITFYNETIVEKIESKNKFIVHTNKGDYEFDKIVLACGGGNKSLIENLKINCLPFRPSLMALQTKEDTKRLSGLKISNVSVKVSIQNQTYIENGEVLFKDRGLSGICIFNLSSVLQRDENFNSNISIDLLPKMNEKELYNMLKNRLNLKNANIEEYLQGLFHNEINRLIIERLKISNKLPLEKINEQIIINLVYIIKNLVFHIVGFYDNNQVYCGGVKLQELSKDLELKTIPNMFVCGEMCNVDGKCGGYNLQWAWTSGDIVGEKLCSK